MLKVLRRFLPVLILVALTIATNAQAPKVAPTHVPKNTIGKVGTGIYRGWRVNYVIVNGRMIFDGDIVLERVEHIFSGNLHPGATIDYLQYRWPLVGGVYQIPYMIDPASGDVSNINAAISTYNSLLAGVIQWVPLTSQTDYVDFDLTDSSGSGEGFSYIGRVGGKQIIGGATNCSVATLLHEMGHATGFWHEQERPDRDNYVTVNLDNMVTTTYPNSQKQFDDMQALTLYDWSSIMEYFPLNFTKNGNPVIETIPPGMPLANTVGYSAGDIDAIKRLYQAVPTGVTIATNPAGLQVIVDGATVTTPQSFNWPLHSTHTLSVPSGVQSQAGVVQGTTTSTTFYYTFGRWNDNGAESHTITVLPGNNELAFPASRPAVTVYMASFIQLVPYTATAFPTGAGTTTPSPAPQSYPGVSGLYYVAREPVTLTATPSAGQNFYQFNNSPYWVDGGLSVNPKTFLVPDTGNPVNMTTYFTPVSSPIYTFDSNPDGSRFYVIVDGGFWPAPTSFSPFYNSAWNAGSNHRVSVQNPEFPWTLNTRYGFVSWSDGGALNHTVTLPTSSTNYTATLQPQYFLSDYVNEGTCAGSIDVMPSSPTGDSYYPTGTPLTFTATPNAGWVFTEWEQNLSGTTNPLNVTMNDEITGIADFNTIATPFTLIRLSLSGGVAGGGNFTLTLSGTGFTPATLVFVNNLFRTSKFVNANTITVAMTPNDLKTPGGFQIFAESFPSGATCAAFGALPFNVASNSSTVKPTPLSLPFGPELVGTASASKAVTIKNTSSSTVNINSIAATGNFSIVGPAACGSQLGAGASCAVNVAFTPDAAGSITGSLTITNSAPDSPQIVALSGSAVLPLSISPTTLPFGTVNVGTTSAPKTFTVTSNESSTLNFSFAAGGNYAINPSGTTCGASLASKAKCNIAVTFTPTANGAVNGAVTITDGTSFSPQIVALSGTGAGGPVAPLSFTPPSLTFSSQVDGTSSGGKTVTLKNGSANPLTLGSIAWSGAYSAAGTGAKPCTANLLLNAGASCTLSVTFSPASGMNGTIQGAIVISDNASVGQQILNVKGLASLPLSFAPPSLAFAAQTVATTSPVQTVTITNNLTTSVSPTITGGGEFSVVPGGPTPCAATLSAHAMCTFTVTFTPTAIGTRPGAITVTDAATPGVQTLNVTGTGQ